MSGMLFDLDTLNAQPKVKVKHDDPKAKDLPHLYGKHIWHPAKPICWCGMSLRRRIRAAWYVLMNRAVAVRWY